MKGKSIEHKSSDSRTHDKSKSQSEKHFKCYHYGKRGHVMFGFLRGNNLGDTTPMRHEQVHIRD